MTEPGRPDDVLRRLPLQLALVLALLGLAAVGLVVSGVVVTTQLRSYLVQQVDDDLAQLAQRQPRPSDMGGGAGDNPFQTSRTEYLGIAARDGSDLRGQTTNGASPPALDLDRLLDAGNEPFTVPADGAGADWRVLVRSDLVVARTGQPVLVVRGVSLGDVHDTTRRLVAVEVLVGLGVLVLLGALSYAVVRSSLRPLAEVEDAAVDITRGNLARRAPPADPRTEVGRVSLAFNTMVDQIEHAFRAREASEQRLRQFVSDAGHELRTPLTSIRGFAELHRQGAVTDPAEVARAMARIESEAARMGLLVEDLVMLARLDEQRPLDVTDVDLAPLVADAVADVRGVQPERPVSYHVPGSVVVRGDEARLRQVLANLVGNAVQHTGSDVQVAVRLRREGDAAVLEVTDAGQGMPPDVAQRVFERFYRADASRTRASGGSGLGLSIVASLVQAHGGTIELETAPGRGSSFRVRLPLARPVT
jgi:two-component system, OmpR family, sensor kinase